MKCKRCGRDKELQPNGLCFGCILDRIMGKWEERGEK